jgi:hypothetical protein
LAAPAVLASLVLLWQPAGGGELNHSPITVGSLRTSSFNALSGTYAVLGPLDAPLAEGLVCDPPRTGGPELARLERCACKPFHFSFGTIGGEPRAWVWKTGAKVVWKGRGAPGHLQELAEWAYQSAFLPRCPQPNRLPAHYFR